VDEKITVIIEMITRGIKARIKEFSDLRKSVDGVGKGAKDAGKGVDEFGRKLKKRGSIANRVWERMKTNVVAIVAAAIGLRGIIRTVRNLTGALLDAEDALAQVSTLIDTTETSMKSLEEAVFSVSRVLPKTPGDLGIGLYQTLSSGITEVNDALVVMEQSAKLAVAGALDTRSAVDAVTTVMNAYGLAAGDATFITDQFFQTVRLGKTTVPELAKEIGTVASTASLTGTRLEEVGAALATMTKLGLGTAESANSLNRFLLSLLNSTEKQRKAAKDLGIEWNLLGLEAAGGLLPFMRQMNDLTDGQIDKLAKLNPNIRAARSAFILAGTGLEAFTEILEQMGDASGSTETALRKMTETTRNQAQVAKNRLSTALSELTDNVLPVYIDLLETAAGLVERLTGGSNEFITTATELGRFDLARAFKVDLLEEQINDAIEGFRQTAGTFRIGQAQDFAQNAGIFNTGLEDLSASRIQESIKEALSVGGEEGLEIVRRRLVEIAEVSGNLIERQGRALESGRDVSARAIDLARQALMVEAEGLADVVASFEELVQIQNREDPISLREQREEERQAAEDAANRLLDLKRRGEELTATLLEGRDAFLEAFDFSDLQGIPGRVEVPVEVDIVGGVDADEILEAGGVRDSLKRAGERIRELLGVSAEGGISAQESLAASESLVGMIAGGEEENAREAAALLAAFERLSEAMEAFRRAEARVKAMEEREEATRDLVKAQLDVEGALDNTNDELEEADDNLESLTKRLADIRRAIDGITRMADAFGILDDSLRRVLDGARSVFESLERIGDLEGEGSFLEKFGSLGTGTQLQAIGGAVSAGVGIVQGIGGAFFGESEEEKALRKATETLTQAIRDLEDALVRGADLAPQEVSLLTNLFSDIASGGTRAKFLGTGALNSLESLGEALGVDLVQSGVDSGAFSVTEDGNLRVEDQGQLQAFARIVLEAINDLGSIGAVNINSFAGAMEFFREQVEQLDLESAGEQFEKFNELVLDRFAPDLARSLEGLSQQEQSDLVASISERLFREGISGVSDFFGPDVSFNEARDILSKLDTLIEGGVLGAGDETQSFSRNVQITEARAGRLLAVNTTIATRADQLVALAVERNTMLSMLSGLEARAAQNFGGINGASAGLGGGVTIQDLDVNVNITGVNELDQEEAQNAGETIGENLATTLDRLLQEHGLRSNRAAGGTT